MKYLSELFVPCDSFLETNILLTSKWCILNSFFFLCSFHSFLYWVKKKCKQIFYTNLGFMNNLYFKIVLLKSYLTLKITIC